MQLEIPRRIVQTSRDGNLSIMARASAKNLKLLHPGWDYCFFDDQQVQQFVDLEFPNYRSVFDGFAFRIQRYDFFRYLAIYRLGGFYFDLDVFLSDDLSDLLTKGCVFPFEQLTISRFLRDEYGVDWEVGNYGFGAAPGHPALGAVIENCVKGQRDPRWVEQMLRGIPRILRPDYYVLYSTGPGLVSRTLAERPDLADGVTILFPENVCDSRNWHKFGEIGVHLMSGSWRRQRRYIYKRLAGLCELRIQQRLLGESIRLGGGRSYGG